MVSPLPNHPSFLGFELLQAGGGSQRGTMWRMRHQHGLATLQTRMPALRERSSHSRAGCCCAPDLAARSWQGRAAAFLTRVPMGLPPATPQATRARRPTMYRPAGTAGLLLGRLVSHGGMSPYLGAHPDGCGLRACSAALQGAGPRMAQACTLTPTTMPASARDP